MTTKPHSILLAVTGLTPQVVTETLFALYQQGATLPEQIHILTTAEGSQRAQLTLLNDGWLARLYSDYQLPPVNFSIADIHVLENSNGEYLTDIRSQTDNQAMADCITEWIRTLTANPDTALHVSIAGGRKTMGFYAGYALSLYGRPQDRLSHVLVTPEYESHPQFYYPTPYSQVIYANDPTRKPLDTQNAEVMLADIAFVRLRHGLDNALLDGKSSFSASVAKAQQALGPASLRVNSHAHALVAHGVTIKLSPADLAFYLWLLNRQHQSKAAPTCPCEGAPEPEYAAAYLMQYLSLNNTTGGVDRTLINLKDGMSKSFFEQRKSRINKTLETTLGPAASAYLIKAEGKRPKTSYRIGLIAEQIEFDKENRG
ncbi:TIGR02584 family CRISPR-associated protein [Methylomonas paludis]|uniref:TIGR02584 family CRISPR-associated protein n=1 Tax=Methylomonas paludis TaxID=1173101 RepID=A0A975MPI5_9GAMM|nr:CRISPR-associated ring nuclease Csm6 [Methylomonas paludis]QWF71560.1 TIGR02584 family CRISPR-associated protein [Methylomonas paludis]